ncbi:hypothetical protein BDW66DRAFT_111117 [Aspergillus desertorum]
MISLVFILVTLCHSRLELDSRSLKFVLDYAYGVRWYIAVHMGPPIPPSLFCFAHCILLPAIISIAMLPLLMPLGMTIAFMFRGFAIYIQLLCIF